MDLSSPLSSLIPSMDAAALEVLVRTQTGLRVSKIRQLSRRGSRQGIANALERLVEHGLVHAEPTNFGFTYRLNRNHILATVVFEAANARHELFSRLSVECSQLDPQPLSAVVFGSLARGDSTPFSDLDLLLILDERPQDPDLWIEQVQASHRKSKPGPATRYRYLLTTATIWTN